MRQITFGKKKEALELYLDGFSTNEIVDKTRSPKELLFPSLRMPERGNFPNLN